MRIRTLFAGLLCAAFASWPSAQPLAWDDPAISDGPCTSRPKAYPVPVGFAIALATSSHDFRLFVPFGSATYYRWVHQKVHAGVAATNQSQILATKPRIFFPDLLALFIGAQGRVDVKRQPVDGKYYIRVVGANDFATIDVTVNILNPPNPSGYAPNGFGGWNVPTVNMWADKSALLEWHCFETSDNREVQVFNILSIHPVLTPPQVSAISTVLQGYGFQTSNFITIPY